MYYSCRSLRQGRLGEFVSSSLFCASIILVAVGLSFDAAKSIFLALSAAVFFAGALSAARFCFTSYEYTVDGEEFTVREMKGRRSAIRARIPVSLIEKAASVKGKAPKRRGGSVKLYDYRAGLMPKSFAALTVTHPDYCEGREKLVILISADEKMLRILGG